MTTHRDVGRVRRVVAARRSAGRGASGACLAAIRAAAAAAGGAGARKRVLAWADTRNGQAQHESVGHALAIIERLGYESGLWDTFIRTDSNIISKTPKKTDGTPASGGPNLNNVDAIFFMGHREVPLDAAQKEELLSFVRDGKGFVAAHVALTAFDSWPEFLDLIGARFDGHPISGPGTVINEQPGLSGDEAFPAVVSVQRRVLSAEGSLAREDRRAAAARSVERAGEPEPAPERRLSARVGEDVRQGPRVLRLVRAFVARPGTAATSSRCTSRRCAGRSGLTDAELKPHPMTPAR